MDQRIQKIEKELAELKAVLSKDYDLDEAWLFGSQAKGEQKEWSDIDVALVSNSFAGDVWDKRIKLTLQINKINDNFELHLFSPEEFANPYDPLVAEIKKYGVRI